MARKPKPARSIEASATAAEPELPRLDEAPAAARRGRPPKSAERPAAPLPVAEDSSDPALGSADAGDAMAADAEVDASDTPSKKRQGRKPKPSAGVVAAPLSRDEPRRATGKRGRKPEDAEPAAEPENAVPSSEAVDEDGRTAGSGANDWNAAEGKPADEAATTLAMSGPAASSKPAAHWDRATDTVQFDWPEIERTASQDGPNQVMAKLLVAARAEGAQSRWPF